MRKPAINLEEEYNSAPMPEEQPPVDEQTDIEVSPEQMATMKQLASEQKFEELGRMVAGLLSAAPAEPMQPMM